MTRFTFGTERRTRFNEQDPEKSKHAQGVRLCFVIGKLQTKLVPADLLEFPNCLCTEAHVFQRTQREGFAKTGNPATSGKSSHLYSSPCPFILSDMSNNDRVARPDPPKQRSIPTVSATCDDGSILEMVLRPDEKRSAFVIWRNSEWRMEPSFSRDAHTRLVAYSPNNNLIRNEVVLFPSEPEEYGSEEQL